MDFYPVFCFLIQSITVPCAIYKEWEEKELEMLKSVCGGTFQKVIPLITKSKATSPPQLGSKSLYWFC